MKHYFVCDGIKGFFNSATGVVVWGGASFQWEAATGSLRSILIKLGAGA